MSVLYAGIKRHAHPSSNGQFRAINVHFLPILDIRFPVMRLESKAPMPNNEPIQLACSLVNARGKVQFLKFEL